jgi:hypothetical protein
MWQIKPFAIQTTIAASGMIGGAVWNAEDIGKL